MVPKGIYNVSISFSTKTTLSVCIPVNADGLMQVTVNGITFYKKGVVKEIVRVAPVRYLGAVFIEVNELVKSQHFSQEASLKAVADKYGFEFDNFRRAYYARGGPLMKSETNLTTSDVMHITKTN